MRHILSRPSSALLATFARARTLLAFDFDGTLAPTVPDRDRAAMRAATRQLFARVCRLYPCVVISGRSRKDVGRRLGGAPVRDVVGNHGVEPSPDMKVFEDQVAAVKPGIARALFLNEGVEIEDKRYSLALHYRRSQDKAKARRQIRAATSDLDASMRSVAGRLVINIVPQGAPHKGDALLHLWRQDGAERAIFVGDDVTDEDIFELGQPKDLLTIRVGRSRASAARYYLRDQREMDVFLTHLGDLRGSGAP